jgi:hypothetical protein
LICCSIVALLLFVVIVGCGVNPVNTSECYYSRALKSNIENKMRSHPFWLVLVPTMIIPSSQAASSRHVHQGKVEPFLPGDPQVSLDQQASEILAAEKPHQTKIQSGECSIESVDDEMESIATCVTTDTPKTIDAPKRMSLTRYVLVASVVGLIMYDVHLYLSQ